MNLNGPPATAAARCAIRVQIQPALAQLIFTTPAGLFRNPIGCWRAKASQSLRPNPSANAFHRRDEILDHSIRVGMIDVEAVELAIGWKIDARLPLQIENYPHRVGSRLIARQRSEPVGYRVRTNSGGSDAWCVCGCYFQMAAPIQHRGVRVGTPGRAAETGSDFRSLLRLR